MKAFSNCWLDYGNRYLKNTKYQEYKKELLSDIQKLYIDPTIITHVVKNELDQFFSDFFESKLSEIHDIEDHSICCGLSASLSLAKYVTEADKAYVRHEGFIVRYVESKHIMVLIGGSEAGLIYGMFRLVGLFQQQLDYKTVFIREAPHNPLRLLNHWDNLDGTVERGYAGNSIFFNKDQISYDSERIHQYARLLASVGINGAVINNVNVKDLAPFLLTEPYLVELVGLADILRPYNIRLFLSINFMSPVLVGGLETADPLNPQVDSWWHERVRLIYDYIPDFGGFLVKADSEYNPGPHTYGRSQSEGANMLARALRPYGGFLIWRAFVYKLQDWRDTSIDRARAAYDIFKPLDGQFDDNVILQIKNGPLDFQVREPVSPLFGAMEKTNQILELQITQEYTGHQIDLCYLAPQWKEVLDFDPHIGGRNCMVSSIINGIFYDRPAGGTAAVANIGDSLHWTGHWLSQANWYAYGRLSWKADLSSEDIANEWVRRSISNDEDTVSTIVSLLEKSWLVYEKYTTPFGLGWMVTPGIHYGPSPEGYEYSIWGTYHRANNKEIGVDRTNSGTGFSTQYSDYWSRLFDNRDTCPESLILFFHRLPYTYKMKNGKTLVQNYYDAHYEGYEAMRELQRLWNTLEQMINPQMFSEVKERFVKQEENARQWRDVINSYFYRKCGIADEQGRPLY